MALLPVYASLIQAVRPDGMDRVVAMANEKGGVGKTTLAANILGQLAEAGYNVLGIDLNRQANLADDLGYRDRPGVDDQGESLYEAIRRPDRNALVAHEVRPRLWVVPGGTELTALTPLVSTKVQTEGREANLSLAAAIVPVAANYDVILIDSPPENVPLLDLTLAASRWVIMPTRSDPGGLRGMKLTATRFMAAQEINPSIGLLGAVLFGTLPKATAIHEEVRADVAKAFGGVSPMLAAFIRFSERVAFDSRKAGLLAHELEIADPEARKALLATLVAKGRKKGRALSASTGNVASDFRDVAKEVLDIIAAAEQGQQENGDNDE